MTTKKLKFVLLKKFLDFQQKFLPNWYILTFDILTVFFTLFVAYAIRLNFGISQMQLGQIVGQAFIITLIYSLSFLIFRPYSGVIRHTSFRDAARLLQASGTAFGFVLLLAYGIRMMNLPVAGEISLGALVIHFLVVYFVLLEARLIIKSMFYRITGARKKNRKQVIIYGAGASGVLTKNALIQETNTFYRIVAFADDNPGKVGKKVEGVKIYTPEHVLSQEFVEKTQADQLIISIQNIDADKQKEVIEHALSLNLEVKVVPSVKSWINGKLSAEQIRRVKIEELLQRDTIKMDCKHVAGDLYGKVVMVTGAAGSIGSGIVKQVLEFRPAKLILLDQAESALYDLQFEINSNPDLKPFAHLAEYVIANIKDRFRLDQIFSNYRPDVIYHAAAYKHVPLMENNPYEALLVNVFGTKALADLSVKYNTRKFVMVSTDKAVNPTNVMGASKRIAEIYAQGLSNGRTQFITTRFGNVLDSNGSVVPLFRKQIEKGGPVTLTHRDITRYFMTIPEACSLVLEAGAMGKGGEIFVFDMGKPVKIYDLAKKMIKLSGFEPGRDIEIKEVGLRPGEKLYEEVLSDQENTLPTYHPKILRAQVRTYRKEFVEKQMDELASLVLEGNAFDVVRKMKEIVPEYISNNSVYDILDKNKSIIEK